MSDEKKPVAIKLRRLPSILIKVFIALTVLVSFVICANNVMEYGRIKEETAKLSQERDALAEQRSALSHYLEADMDEKYMEHMAREAGYCYPDEIIYFVE